MTRPLFSSTPRSTLELVRTPPIVPLPISNDQPPVLLVFDETDLGIELAYEREPEPGGTRVRAVSRDTTRYHVPPLTPVFAITEGVIVYAREHVDGHTIVIDHCNDWLSVYQRLEYMFVTPTDRGGREKEVLAGDILGYLGSSSPGDPLQPLRFELWKWSLAGDYEQVDPLRYVRRWQYLDWRDARLDTSSARGLG